MSTHRTRLANLEHLAAMRPPPAAVVPDRWPTLADLPTVRWDDPDAVAAFTDDIDILMRHDAAHEAYDWRGVDRLQPEAFDTALRVYAVIPGHDERPDQWRARVARMPVDPIYYDHSATW